MRHLIAIWYNRVIIGLAVGLAAEIILVQDETVNRYLRGLVLGLLISLAAFLSMEQVDVVTFLAGGLYGLATEYVAHRWG
jgi:hypothetical protein